MVRRISMARRTLVENDNDLSDTACGCASSLGRGAKGVTVGRFIPYRAFIESIRPAQRTRAGRLCWKEEIQPPCSIMSMEGTVPHTHVSAIGTGAKSKETFQVAA